MHEAAATPAWVLIAYLIAGICFILALRGLSSPASSQRGNRLGMIGMAIAVATTLAIHDVASTLEIAIAIAIGGAIGLVTARRIQMTAMPQLVAAFHSPRRHGRGAGRRGGVSQPPSVRHSGRWRHLPGEPGRARAGRRDRCDYLLRIGDRFPQAQRQHERLADPATAAPCAQPRHAGRDPRADRLLHAGPVAVGVLDDHRPGLRDRLPADHPDRRGGHAGRGVDAQQLLGLGGGGDGLHARQYRDDHHRRPGRKLGRDPQLHHVPRDES